MQATLIYPGSKTYPPLLKEMGNPPSRLWVKGEVGICAGPCVSIVGSRKMSAYGKQVIGLLVPQLVRAGLTIVSGLAQGIDAEAHRMALKSGGRCAVVLGSGFNRVYPSSNQPLLREILAAGGCALTEYKEDVGPQRYHFPTRNRIVAGLSQATVVIEAGEKSGTLITARHALDAGREVFAVLGDITREGSAGIARLLRQGAAPVVEAADILSAYAGLPLSFPAANLRPALTGAMADLYDLISRGTETVDALIYESGYGVAEVQSVLTILELDGYVYRNGTKWQKTL